MKRASSGARKDEGKRFARFTMWRGGCGCGNGRRAEATQPSKFDREAQPTVALSAAKGLREAMRSFSVIPSEAAESRDLREAICLKVPSLAGRERG